MKKFIRVASLLIFSGCAVIEPVVQNFNIISIDEEKEIGEKMSQEISKEMTIVQDSSANQRVRSLGSRLVQALPRRDFDYRFYVVKDDTPNAFTIPGGSIYVHTGLLRFVDDDNELAGVLGHEIGHAYDRDPVKGLSRAYGVDYLTSLLFKDTQGKFKTMALQIAKGGLLMKYSREDELQADELGYNLLRRAGFATSGLIRFLEKLQAMQNRGTPLPFLSTHPPTPERISRLKALDQRQIQSQGISSVPALYPRS